MHVADVMHHHVVTVSPSDSLADAERTMRSTGYRHLPVLAQGEVVGVLSERDVLRYRSEHDELDANKHQVRAAMTAPATCVNADADAAIAARRLALHHIGCLPVLDHGDLVGIVTAPDLLHAFAWTDRDRTVDSSHFTAKEVMTPSPVTTSPDEYLVNAIAKMKMARVRHLPVVDTDDRIVGMLSDRDLLLEAELVSDPYARFENVTVRVGSVMSPDPFWIFADTPESDLFTAFAGWRLSALPVVDREHRIVGIVSYVDVLGQLSKGEASSRLRPKRPPRAR